jgi:hypothetical protein
MNKLAQAWIKGFEKKAEEQYPELWEKHLSNPEGRKAYSQYMNNVYQPHYLKSMLEGAIRGAAGGAGTRAVANLLNKQRGRIGQAGVIGAGLGASLGAIKEKLRQKLHKRQHAPANTAAYYAGGLPVDDYNERPLEREEFERSALSNPEAQKALHEYLNSYQ